MILAELSGLQAPTSYQRGNAMIYVLLAIALFGILTATLSSQNNQADGQDIDDEMVALYANELIEYAAAAKQAVDQMIMTGSTIDDLDFVNPSSTAFDTPPHIHKVFHPQGGGLNYQKTYSEAIIAKIPSDPDLYPGWHTNTLANVEWTPSTQPEVIISALRIKKEVCEKINEKITGSATIPNLPSNILADILQENQYTTDLTAATCPGCEGYNTLCILNNTVEDWFGVYTILAAQ